MGPKLLITGAAGYIGGSVLAALASNDSNVKKQDIIAVVRSDEQVKALSKLGVKVLKLDLNDEAGLRSAIIHHEVDIVIHTTSSVTSQHVRTMVQALGQRKKTSGNDTYFVHTSVAASFTTHLGWPAGETKDSEALYQTEKKFNTGYPVLATHIVLVEEAKAHGVKSFIIPVPHVYGVGTGSWRKISVNIPAHIRAAIKDKAVHKFDTDSTPGAVHIQDLVSLYTSLVAKILQNAPIPSGENGYYFGIAHRVPIWDTLDRVAADLHSRGLIDEPKARVWDSDEMASEHLGFPVQFIRTMCTSSGEHVPVNAATHLGWKPQWTRERWEESLEEEVKAVLETEDVPSTLFTYAGYKK